MVWGMGGARAQPGELGIFAPPPSCPPSTPGTASFPSHHPFWSSPPGTPAFFGVLRLTPPHPAAPHPEAAKPASLILSSYPPKHPPGLCAIPHIFSCCSREPIHVPFFGNTSPIALTFSHTDKQRLTNPEIDSHRAERHRPCPAGPTRTLARRHWRLSWREAHRRGVCART